MAATGTTGTLEPTGSTVTVRFERSVDAPPDALWAALTEPKLLSSWLAEAEFEGIVGGKVRLLWPEDQGEMRGVVTIFEPFEIVEYSWNEESSEESSSLLRLEVESRGSGSTLRLVHADTTPADAVGFGAGWQSHLEALDVVLAGGESSSRARDARYQELRPAYERLATTSG